MQFIHTLVPDESLISDDTKEKIDKDVYQTLGFSILFKIGNKNKWLNELYNTAKKSNFTIYHGDIDFDHTLFLQGKQVGFWYDNDNWNYAF